MNRSRKLLFMLVLTAIGIIGCKRVELYSLSEPTASATPWVVTEAPTLTPSATIVWFPSTATPRPLSTPTPFPTQDMRPNIGRAIITDGFANESDWQTFRSDQGNAVWSNEELTLAIQRTAGGIESYADLPWLENFYLTLDITLPICSNPEDVYGLIFRASDSENYVRIWVNCLGQTKAEARIKGKLAPLTDWKSSGYIFAAAPQKYQFGLYVKDNRIRLFVNDHFLYEFEEKILSPGGFGLTARSAGIAPITVSFSNLRIYSLN